MTLGISNKSRSFYSAFAATFVSLALAHQAGATEPLVFWASDPVQPGQTVQVSGSGFAESTESKFQGWMILLPI